MPSDVFDPDDLRNDLRTHGHPRARRPTAYDAWCKADWHKNATATGTAKPFCEYTINDCYDDAMGGEPRCREIFGDNALGGSEITDFLCGGDDTALGDDAVCSFVQTHSGGGDGGGDGGGGSGSNGDSEGSGGQDGDESDEAAAVNGATSDGAHHEESLPAELFARKAGRAIFHVRNRYRWVGVLEHLGESLQLLAHQLPGYFGNMGARRAREAPLPHPHTHTSCAALVTHCPVHSPSLPPRNLPSRPQHHPALTRLHTRDIPATTTRADLKAWGSTDLAPTGEDNSDPRKKLEAPSAATVAVMRRDAFLQMDYIVYDAAVQRLRCQLAACGLPPLQPSGGGNGGSGDGSLAAGASARLVRKAARRRGRKQRRRHLRMLRSE